MAIKAVLVRLDSDVIEALESYRGQTVPIKSRCAVIRKALEEFLERAGVAPEPAAPAKVTRAPTKVLEKAPLDWR